jgi:hypothetical protein
MPYDQGLPLLAHRQLEWYLGAFFFALVSAYDTLLQELNIIYAYTLALKPKDVRWNDRNKNNFMKKLPEEIYNLMVVEQRKDWFYKVQWYRNTATHHYLVPLGSSKAGFGEEPLDYDEHKVFIHYLDKDGNMKGEEITACIDYLKNMVKHIKTVWQQMIQEFQ